MTEFEFNLLELLYAVVVAYVLLGGWRWRSRQSKVRLVWFLALPALLFAALWYSGRVIWTIQWWYRIGDNSGYEEAGARTTLAVALFLSIFVFARLAFGVVSQQYAKYCTLSSMILATAMALISFHDFVSRIDGWSARGAAENYFADITADNNPFTPPGAIRQIVEEDLASTWQGRKDMRRFVLCYGKAKIYEVHVSRYGWWWWSCSGSSTLPQILWDVEWIRDKLQDDPAATVTTLKTIVRDYPNSEASRIASELLESVPD